MSGRELSKEERDKFSNFFRSWYNSQKRYKLIEISKEVKIPISTLYDYVHYNKGPNSIEKANTIINFIKKNQQEKSQLPKIPENINNKEKIIDNLMDNTVLLCQISELNEALQKLHSSIESIQKHTNSNKELTGNQQINELNKHLNSIELSLFSLYSELLWFKNSSSENRKVLRKSLNSKDIGYIT
jgi:hypothetical protein